MDTIIVLEQDKEWARRRIAELDEEILALGPEFHEALNQSSETWHDNAPFDALRERQSVLDAERQQLRQVLRRSLPSVPKAKQGVVAIGRTVTLRNDKGKERNYLVAGDWTPRAGAKQDGHMVVSVNSPLAQALLGKKAGEQTSFGTLLVVE